MADAFHATDRGRGGQLHFRQMLSSWHLAAVVVTVHVVTATVVLMTETGVADSGAVGRMLTHSLRMMEALLRMRRRLVVGIGITTATSDIGRPMVVFGHKFGRHVAGNPVGTTWHGERIRWHVLVMIGRRVAWIFDLKSDGRKTTFVSSVAISIQRRVEYFDLLYISLS